jgi:hypothetical protein
VLAGIEYVSLGQRSLATFPFYTIYDREANTAQIELGGAVAMGKAGTNGTAAVVAIGIVVIIVVLLIYLIALRHMRLKAEEWYEANKHVLFCPIAAKLRSEHDILKKLVDGKEKGMSYDQRVAMAPEGVSTENLLEYEAKSGTPSANGYRANSMGSTGKRGPPLSKQFKEEFQ